MATPAISETGRELLARVEAQLDELERLIAGCEEEALRRPCPGREKLGDGTAGALALHIATSYGRLAAFLRQEADPGRLARLRRRLGISSATGHGGPGRERSHAHGGPRGRAAERGEIGASAGRARAELQRLGDLTGEQLEATPSAGGIRFADGRRSIAEIVGAALVHQQHQLDALRAAAGWPAGRRG